MKKLVAAFVVWGIGCLFAFLAWAAWAGPLDDFAQGYASGTALVSDSYYSDLYAKSTDRQIEFTHAQEFPGRIDAYYRASMVYDGAPYVQTGVTSAYLESGVVTRLEFAPIDSAAFDLALAGHGADMLTTGAALHLGFSEGNPAVAGLLSSPAGVLAWAGLKYLPFAYADRQGLAECVQVRTVLGAFGWGAAAWNVGMVASGPLAAVVLGLSSALLVSAPIRADAPTQCIEPTEDFR